MATLYFIPGGSNLWNNSNSWSLSSGGASGAGVPTSADSVIFDVNSTTNCTVASFSATVSSFNATNYNRTIIFGSSLITLAVINSVVLGSSMTFSGVSTNYLLMIGNTSLTSNNSTLSVPLYFYSNGSGFNYTLNDNWSVSNVLTNPGSGSTLNINNNFIKVSGNFSANLGSISTTTTTSGTTEIIFTGNSSLSFAGGHIDNPITISSSTTTMPSFTHKTGKLTYNAGTISGASITTGITIDNSCTFSFNSSSSNIIPISIILNNGSTMSLNLEKDLYISGKITVIAGTMPYINGFTLYNYGNLIGGFFGSTNLVFSGTNSNSKMLWDGFNANHASNVSINTPGSLTMSNIVNFYGSQFNYTLGTVNADNTSTVVIPIGSTLTLDTSVMFFNNCSFGVASNITLNSKLNVTNNISIYGSNLSPTSFLGNYGFDTNFFIVATNSTSVNIVFKNGVTYSVNKSITLDGSLNVIYLKSDINGSKAILSLLSGEIVQYINNVNVTDIDSSFGSKIWGSTLSLTNTLNWNQITSGRTLINTSSGNIDNFVWNLVIDTYVGMSGSNGVQVPSFFSAGSFTTFSGGYSVSHIGIKLGYPSLIDTFAGTFSVAIGSGTSANVVAGSRVDYNIKYLPYYSNYNSVVSTLTTINGSPESGFNDNLSYNTWVVFKLPSIISLTNSVYNILVAGTGTKLYYIQTYNTGINSTINSFLVKTATASKNISDTVIIAGEYYGNTNSNINTIVVDTIKTSDYFKNISVNTKSILNFSTASAYNPILSVVGNLNIFGGAEFNIGTSVSRFPVNSIATLVFNGTFSDNSSGGLNLRVGSKFSAYGATNTYKTLLSNNAVIGATFVNTTDTTNWNASDYILMPSTELYTDYETFTLSSASSGLTLSLSKPVTKLKTGVAPYIGEVLNLTRNIKIFSRSTTYPTYIYPISSIINLDSIEMFNMGVNGSTLSTYGKGGVSMLYTSIYDYNSISIKDSSIRNSFSGISSADYTTGNITKQLFNTSINNNILYNISNLISYGLNNGTSSGLTISNNIFVAGNTIFLLQPDMNFTNNTITNFNSNISLIAGILPVCSMFVGNLNSLWYGDFNNLTMHTNNSGIFILNSLYDLSGKSFDNLNIWKNASSGIRGIIAQDLTFRNLNLLSNNTLQNTTDGDVLLGFPSNNLKFYSSTFSSTRNGFYISTQRVNLKFENCYFGSHSVADFTLLNSSAAYIDTPAPNAQNIKITGNNTYLNSTTNLSGNLISNESYFKFSKLNGVTGSYKSWYTGGIIVRDASLTSSKTGNSSVRATPNTLYINSGGTTLTEMTATNSGIYLQASRKTIPVFQNKVLNIGVYINKSTNYNGLQPRLIIGRNYNLGIYNDTVIATCIAVNNKYEYLFATQSIIVDSVVDIWVDCNGSNGYISVDNWIIS